MNINRRVRVTGLAVAALAAVAPASASASILDFGDAITAAQVSSTCGAQGTPHAWQAFLRFGDAADYWLAPGGNFESGTRGWSLTNAAIANGNDAQNIVDGGHSLALGAGLVSGAEAISPPICVTAAHPTFRYMLKAEGAAGLLSTFIRYRAADGTTREMAVHSKTATTLLPGQWKPSDLQPLATKMNMASVGGVAVARLVFRTPVNVAGAGYRIDNVLVDPYRTR